MNIQKRYNEVQEGQFSKADFLLEARQDSRINKTFSHLNSFDEVVSIFKGKGYLTEPSAPVEKDAFDFRKILKESISDINDYDEKAPHPEKVNAFEYEKGWRYELNAKKDFTDKGILDAQHKAIKNLEKDALYYTRIEMGKYQPTEKEVEDSKMIDISKGKNLKAPNQPKELKGKNTPGITDEERVKIEKIKTELYEGLKKKSSREQLEESVWEKVKHQFSKLSKFDPNEAKEAAERLQYKYEESVDDNLKKLYLSIQKVSPEFPNCESGEAFAEGVKVIAMTYDSVVAATKLDPSDKDYIEPHLANLMISNIQDYVEVQQSKLAHVYTVFKESQALNENVTVTAGEGITQILQKMTGVNLGASQSVDNLKSAIEKVGSGNYSKGLEVVKKLFTNNNAGSIDQQADKLTDIISHGGKLGDAFTKTQGTFGGKGLFSIKLPPDTTEKIINTVAKAANKASQAVDTVKQVSSIVKGSGTAVKQAVLNVSNSGHLSSVTIAALIGTIVIAGATLAYMAKRDLGKNRYKDLDALYDRILYVEVPNEDSTETNATDNTNHSKYQPQEEEGNEEELTDDYNNFLEKLGKLSNYQKAKPLDTLNALTLLLNDYYSKFISLDGYEKSDIGDLTDIVFKAEDGTVIKLPPATGVVVNPKNEEESRLLISQKAIKDAFEEAGIPVGSQNTKANASTTTPSSTQATPTLSTNQPKVEPKSTALAGGKFNDEEEVGKGMTRGIPTSLAKKGADKKQEPLTTTKKIEDYPESVQKLLKQLNIDADEAAKIKPSGNDGKITRQDVILYAQEKSKYKDYPVPVQKALRYYNIPPEEVVKIKPSGENDTLTRQDVILYADKSKSDKPEAPAGKEGEKGKKKAAKPKANENTKELIPYGKSVKFKSDMAPLIKDKPTIVIPKEVDEKGVTKRGEVIFIVSKDISTKYKSDSKQDHKIVRGLIDDLKKKLPALKSKLVLDISNEVFVEDIEKFIKNNSKAKLKEALIIEHLKNLLFESLNENAGVSNTRLGVTIPYPKGEKVDTEDLQRELRNNTPSDNQDYNDSDFGGSIYNNRIDSERLTKIEELIRQLGDKGIAMYNHYAEENGCPPWNGKARIFNPVTVKDDNDRQYVDGEGKKRYVNEGSEKEEIFYTGRGKKFEDLKKTSGDYIFFSKDPKVSEWYGGDESNITSAKLDTSKFLDLTTQEKKSEFVRNNFTDEDVLKIYPELSRRALEDSDRDKRLTYEGRIRELIDEYKQRLINNRFSGDNKEQRLLLDKIKEKGYKGVKLYDTFFGKGDISYVVIDKSVIDTIKNEQQSILKEQTEPNFVPEAQGFLQTINDIYKNCTSKTGLKPFTDHIKNNTFDVEKKQPQLISAFIKYKLKDGESEHKEELQKALEDVKAKYKK